MQPGVRTLLMSQRDEVIFGRPPGHMRVFISSEMRSGELLEARKAIAEAVTETGLHQPWWWEEHGVAGEFCAEAMCLGNARTSEYLILILGSKLTDITRKEYLEAKKAGASVFVFMPKGAKRNRAAQKFFREEVSTPNFAYGVYSSSADLRSRVLDSLKTHAVRAIREYQLGRRISLDGVGESVQGAVS